MSDLLDFEIDYDKADNITAEDALKNEKMVKEVNYAIMEGLVEIEVGDDGEIRLYPTD